MSFGYEDKGKWRSIGKSCKHLSYEGWDGRIVLSGWHFWNIKRWKRKKGLVSYGKQ